MSVPVWLIILSDQLTIVALVGHYPTNKLMVRGLILKQKLTERPPLIFKIEIFKILFGISPPFGGLSPIRG